MKDRSVAPTSHSRRRVAALIAALWCMCALSGANARADAGPADAANNPVARLQRRMDAGEAKLSRDDRQGYLASLLRELGIPVASQTLVFSKTSLQRSHISPRTPRALYFDDATYVGFVRGGDLLEIATADPEDGMAFYTLDQTRGDAPRLARQGDTCIQCHTSTVSPDTPGLLLRSVQPDPEGIPILAAGTSRVTHQTPLKGRWGGWYVTGHHGGQRHMGNVTAKNRDDTSPMDTAAGANVIGLGGKFDTSAYLSPHSDIVALMVMEHQIEAHNLLGRAAHLTRSALRDQAQLNQVLCRPADEQSESTVSRIKNAGEPLVKYLLFSGEAPLTGRLQGTTDFAKEFAAKGPRDDRGRSLREFDLERRMFRHPCSYLIYSEAFDALPDQVKAYVYRRLWQVLTGRDADPAFAHLTEADQRAVYEILLETKPGLPDYWTQRRGGKSDGS